MRWRFFNPDDIPLLARLNLRLQQDDGSSPMALDDIEARMRRWLHSAYNAVIFLVDDQVVAYALFRSTDRDTEGIQSGVFIRQFYVVPEQRRLGVGRRAFDLLRRDIWPENCDIILNTVHDNRRGQSFWRSLGFSEYSVSYVRRANHVIEN